MAGAGWQGRAVAAEMHSGFPDLRRNLPMMRAWMAEAKDEPWIVSDFEF